MGTFYTQVTMKYPLETQPKALPLNCPRRNIPRTEFRSLFTYCKLWKIRAKLLPKEHCVLGQSRGYTEQ